MSITPQDLQKLLDEREAFEIDRLPGRWRQLHTDYIFQHPPDLLKIFPGTFAWGWELVDSR